MVVVGEVIQDKALRRIKHIQRRIPLRSADVPGSGTATVDAFQLNLVSVGPDPWVEKVQVAGVAS